MESFVLIIIQALLRCLLFKVIIIVAAMNLTTIAIDVVINSTAIGIVALADINSTAIVTLTHHFQIKTLISLRIPKAQVPQA